MNLQLCVPQVLSQSDQERIYQSALNILAQIPLSADGTDEFNDAMSALGCRVERKKIYFPQGVIDLLLERVAQEKEHNDSVAPSQPADSITPYVSGQGSLIAETDNDKLRPAITEDLAQLGRFIDAVDDNLHWCHPTFIPTDRPIRTREVHAFATICLNHHQPSRVSPYSPQALRFMYDILKVCLGSDEQVRQNSFLIAHKLWINTPFMLSRESIESVMLSRALLGHKTMVTMMPVAGAAAPITAPGCLALITAEVLVSNIITLALDDELVGYHSSPLTIDFKHCAHVEQDPYSDLLRIGANQMRQFIFGGPPYFNAFSARTAAKVPGPQAMMEKTLGAMLAMNCGGCALASVGTLSYADAASFVQILLDLELTSYLNRLLKGLNCTEDDRLAESINLETIPNGARFMEHEHTAQFFRQEQWFPELSDRRMANSWLADPYTMLENARQKAICLQQTAPNRSPLNQSQKQQISEILENADKDLA